MDPCSSGPSLEGNTLNYMTWTRRVHFNLNPSAVVVSQTKLFCEPRVTQNRSFPVSWYFLVCTRFVLITWWHCVLQRGPEVNPHHKALHSLKKSFSGRINFLSNAFQLDSCIYFAIPGLTFTFLHKKKKKKKVSFLLNIFYRLGKAVPELLEGFRLCLLHSLKPIISLLFSVWGGGKQYNNFRKLQRNKTHDKKWLY